MNMLASDEAREEIRISAPKRWLQRHGWQGYNLWYWITHFWQIPHTVFLLSTWFIQRGRRGYSDRDVWDLNSYLDTILASALEDMAEISHGYPGDTTFEDWRLELLKAAAGFQANLDDNGMSLEPLPEHRASVNWLSRRWYSLWD